MNVSMPAGDTQNSAGTANEPELMVQFRDVSKHFGDLTVLNHLDLDVRTGEKVAIIGPSGSGKSTLLRALMTLEDIDEGVIMVDDEPLTHMPDAQGNLVRANARHLRRVRGKVGMVFQSFNLFPHMSTRQNVMEAPVQVLGLSKKEARERAEELLAMVGLEDKLDHYPSQLSGGQQQRVAIARALAMRPKVMLFDEVTSALDPELCEWSLTRWASRGNSPTVYASSTRVGSTNRAPRTSCSAIPRRRARRNFSAQSPRRARLVVRVRHCFGGYRRFEFPGERDDRITAEDAGQGHGQPHAALRAGQGLSGRW